MHVINRSATKKFILEMFKKHRPGMPIERVSSDALDKLEARFKVWIMSEVQSHPTIGKTFII